MEQIDSIIFDISRHASAHAELRHFLELWEDGHAIILAYRVPLGEMARVELEPDDGAPFDLIKDALGEVLEALERKLAKSARSLVRHLEGRERDE